VNYQVSSCPQLPLEQAGEGACYLMNEACVEGPNECWNLYTLPEDERRAPSFGGTVTRQAGCKNIGTIGMGQSTMFSAFECQHSCETDAECLGFIVKAKGCNADSSQAFALDGDDGLSCQMLRGECEEDTSAMYACWDVHYKSTKQGTDLQDLYHLTEEAEEGDTVFHSTDEECFLVGDTIELFHPRQDATHRYTIQSGVPITISPPLAFLYERGMGVMRIHHPDSPKHCGPWPEE